jgi:hypothetical protein
MRDKYDRCIEASGPGEDGSDAAEDACYERYNLSVKDA